MILADPNPVVIKGNEYSPQIEASAVDPGRFWLCLGGDDYYASEDSLNVEQATALRDLLTIWLEDASGDCGGGTRVSVWRLISCYSDGDRIVEATFDQREDAERMIPRVYEFRSDQTEAPVDVVVEEA